MTRSVGAGFPSRRVCRAPRNAVRVLVIEVAMSAETVAVALHAVSDFHMRGGLLICMRAPKIDTTHGNGKGVMHGPPLLDDGFV